MAENSSQSDQLWRFALQLFEEAKSVSFAQHEEHIQRIQTKYSQLVSYLSCLGDIIAAMYEKEKLSLRELEQIQHLQSTPIRANEELLSIIVRKPRDVYECFLALIRHTQQMHVYQMLVSVDNTCDEAKIGSGLDHRDLICRNFLWLSEKLDTDGGLIPLLYRCKALTIREKEHIFCMSKSIEKNEFLLGLISKKSPEDFEKFIEALETSGQGHLAKKLRKLEDLPTVPASLASTVSGSKRTYHEEEPVKERSVSKPVVPPKILPKSWPKRIPSRYNSKPIPPPKPGKLTRTSSQQYEESMHTVVNTTNYCQRNEEVQFRARLKDLEYLLLTEIAFKVTSISLICSDKPEESLNMCFRTLLQECRQSKEELVAKTEETNTKLQNSATQHSAIATINDVLRNQMTAVQQEMNCERLQSRKERMQSEEKIDNLKTHIQNEQMRWKRIEKEKLLMNTVVMEMEDRLKEAEREKIFYQQQIEELNKRLSSIEYELQKSKEMLRDTNAETNLIRNECEQRIENEKLLMNSVREAESNKQCFQQNINELNARLASTESELQKTTIKLEENDAMIAVLRAESKQLRDACEMLRKENEKMNDLKVQLIQTQIGNQELLRKLKEKEIKLAEQEVLKLNESDAAEQNSLQNDCLLKLEEELEREKRRTHKLEDQLTNSELHLHVDQMNCLEEGIEINVLRSNSQFLLEHMESTRLIEHLHKKNCISLEERDHFMKQPSNFSKNDALLHWMRTIPFKQNNSQTVQDCFRQIGQNFIAVLFEAGGVLIKSKIHVSTKLPKERLFAKSSNLNAGELTQKIIENLNLWPLSPLVDFTYNSPETPTEDVVIAPYCRKEAGGIVIWFWCQSTKGQRNLQRLYESGILLGKLIAIFKQLSYDIVPTVITIFDSDFTRSTEYRATGPWTDKFVPLREPPNVSLDDITGIAVLDQELFVSRQETSDIEVYDLTTFKFIRQIKVMKIIDSTGLGLPYIMLDPENIASCTINKCLYAVDCGRRGHYALLLRIDPITGKIINSWETNHVVGCISIASDANIILNITNEDWLHEYTANGELARKINLDPKRTGICRAWHVVKLRSGLYVVCHGDYKDPLGRVCLLSVKPLQKAGTSTKIFKVEIRATYCAQNGEQPQRFLRPSYLSVNKDDFILVVSDESKKQAVLLNSQLEEQKVLLSEEHGMGLPRRTCFDESNGRWFVADADCIMAFRG